MRHLTTRLSSSWRLVALLALGAFLLPTLTGDLFNGRSGKFSSGVAEAGARVDGAVKKRLKKAVSKGDRKAVEKVIDALKKRGGAEAMELIILTLPSVKEDAENVYWALVEGACSFKDEEAMTTLGELINENSKNPLIADLVYALGKSQSRRVLLALSPIALDGPAELRKMAVRKIGKVYRKESVDLLIEVMKKEEENYKDALSQSKLIHLVNHLLIGMTGHEIQPSSINWEGWWKNNRDKVKVKPRKKGDRKKGSTGTIIDYQDPDEVAEFFGEAGPLSVVVLSAIYKNSRDKGIKLRHDDFNNDHIEHVLDRMDIPHTVVRRQKFEKFNLSKTGAIIINCTQFHTNCQCETCVPEGGGNNRMGRCSGCNKHVRWSAKLSPKSIKKLTRFVQRGGYLFGEDWVVKEIIEKCFPSYIKAGQVIRSAELGEADVVPARGMTTHPYLRGTFEADEVRKRKKKSKRRRGRLRFRWTIDDESWAFDILKKSKVDVLLKSGRLEDYTDGQGAVALAFRPGGSRKTIGRVNKAGSPGVVLMILSHFGKQKSQRDEFALQRVLYNFLLDSRRQMRAMGIKDEPDKKRTKKDKKKKKKKKKKRDDDDDGENIQRVEAGEAPVGVGF